MADLTSGIIGFLVSTVAIVLFGEIFPQALCSRHPLHIGAKAVPLVSTCCWFFIDPLSYVYKATLGRTFLSPI